MLYNTTFNNILAISWWSVLSVEETEVHLAMSRIWMHNMRAVIGTDCTGSCKSNYHEGSNIKRRVVSLSTYLLIWIISSHYNNRSWSIDSFSLWDLFVITGRTKYRSCVTYHGDIYITTRRLSSSICCQHIKL